MNSNIYYKEVGKYSIELSEEDEIALLTEYNEKRVELELHLLMDYSCRDILTELMTSKSPAKLSRKFNKKKKGHNANVAKKMMEIWDSVKDKDWGEEEILSLQEIKFSNKVLKEIETHSSIITKKLIEPVRKRMYEIEDLLVRSVLKAGKEITSKYSSYGMEDDVIQEANEGFLEAVKLYNLNFRTKEGKRVKFVTYAYGRAENKVKEYIMNNSRLVRLPMNQIELILLAIRSMSNLDLERFNTEELRNEMNKTAKTPLSLDEVYGILELLQSTHHSLDHLINPWANSTRNQTLKEILPSEELNPEEELNVSTGNEHIRNVAKNVLKPYGDLSYEVVYCKYLSGKEIKSYQQLSEMLKASGYTNKVLSREGVRQIEIRALRRLAKRAPELKEFLYGK